ncbi:enoyl-CoA hydratase/isomerase family protein [Reyranella sp.]|uniref:enoyl-CoA hydratase/isomerase family protein n=1 Tax=Reyranella sp. TaxID=1929291 RepID=UPI003BAD6A09
MTDTVLLSIDGPRATITLNDPAKHNRLDPAGLALLREAVEAADADPAVRATVITGAGEKTFCSGYDLGSIPAGDKPSNGQRDSGFETVMDRIEAMRMPTLCALNGGVYGGATDLALACDFRLGVKGMRFFMPAARFGLHYYPGGLRRYTQKVSPSFAKRAFLLSEDFSDTDLLAVGYLDWLVEREAFAAKVDEVAARLATLAPLSMANMKRAIEQYAQAEPDVASIRQSMRECASSDDLREGLAALRERRQPSFKGR